MTAFTITGNDREVRQRWADIAERVGDLRREIMSTVPYAAIHQFGGEAGRGKKVATPACPFLPIKSDGTLYPQERADIMQTLTDCIDDLTKSRFIAPFPFGVSQLPSLNLLC